MVFSFAQNFDFLKGQKMALNDQKFCLSPSVSEEPYIILWFLLVHICKMMIYPVILFIFRNFNFWVFRGVERQKMTKNDQFQYVLLYISGTVDHIIKILIMISTGAFIYFFFKKCNIIIIRAISRANFILGFQKMSPKNKKLNCWN